MAAADQTSPRTFKVAIIGAGASGIAAGVELQRKLGLKDFIILEKHDAFGGTWNLNTYPGAASDVLGHVYCYSFAPNPDCSMKWPEQPEIKAYFEKVAHDWDLQSRVQFRTEVVKGTWSETSHHWALETRRSTGEVETIIVKAVISGVGQLNNPSYPNIPGVKEGDVTFKKGPVMHSSRWDHGYDFEGKTVGIIGTGASCIQFAPRIAPLAKKLHIYQRSAAYVMPRLNFKYSAVFKWCARYVPFFLRYYRLNWLAALDRLYILLRTDLPVEAMARRVLNLHLRMSVKDASLRSKLTPDYPVGCKRLLITDEWYETLQRPNVSLHTDKVLRVTEGNIVTQSKDGAEDLGEELDVIVLGTGFKATGFLAPMEFVGMGGRSLRDEWDSKKGAEAYKGFAIEGFPNLFMLYGPGTNLGHNSIIFMVECALRSIIPCLSVILDEKNPTPYVVPRKAVQEAYNVEHFKELEKTTFAGSCGSWYRDRISGKLTTQWRSFVFVYWWITRKVNVEDFEQVGQKPFAAIKAAQFQANLRTYMIAAALVGAGAAMMRR
ncbi:hypothetical protein HK101_000541 [Irineochytrium annulatum]|nr:hypothetical protein HK101_000541 [Irineochytrium annulatum]